LVESISVATELLGKMFSVQAAKNLLKGESAGKRDRALEKNPDRESEYSADNEGSL
jgi:hypothetical protein